MVAPGATAKHDASRGVMRVVDHARAFFSGLALARMSRVKGRTDDLILVKGARFFPSEIEAVLLEVEGTLPHYEIVLERREGANETLVRVEATNPDDAALRGNVERRLGSELGVSVAVELVAPRTLARSEGKARRVIDRRRPG